MNITQETKIIPERWRAEKGAEYTYITISPFGDFRINKAFDYRHPQDERLYDSGNYFRKSEVAKFNDILKAIFKNRC